jgi:purine-binding chemotaxis protein CheW
MGAQYLTFVVAGEHFAVEILRVREVIEAPPITRVPSTPASLRGVANVRGYVLPVIDLSVRFDRTESRTTKWTCVVLVDIDVAGQPMTFGMLVDSVSTVVEIEPDAVEPVPPFGAHVRLEFLKGMGLVGDRFVLLLDVDRVLSTRDLFAAAAIASAPPPAATGGTP